MPDFDTGHIFLTTLAPIKRAENPAEDSLFMLRIRTKLASMQPARQSPATIDVVESNIANVTHKNSPFARNNRTHFARIFVLGDVVYNGRPGGSAISAALFNEKPLIPKQEDHLNCAYLVFCADIDAVKNDGEALPDSLSSKQQVEVRRSYAELLWNTMNNDLIDLYSNCVGFELVASADDFADYLERCHVETTMPFHDYFSTESDVQTVSDLYDFPASSYLSIGKRLGIVAGLTAFFIAVGFLLFLISAISTAFNFAFGTSLLENLLVATKVLIWMPWAVLSFLVIVLLLALLVFVGINRVTKGGELNWPHAEFDDLPSVLKALYIQQKFSQFVINNQGTGDKELHEKFKQYLANHVPEEKMYPSQAPGVISSSIDGGIVKREEL